METLQVGHGRAAITPLGGIHMAGYASRTALSVGVHDELMANAVALSDGAQTVLLLALDLCSLDLEQVQALRTRIQEQTGLPPEAILVNTSHTHAGPEVGGTPGTPEAEYWALLVERCGAAVTTALANQLPATLAVGAAAVEIGGNRRERTPEGEIILGVNRSGPRLPEATIWRFQRADGSALVLFSLPIHGTTISADNLWLSAEWMGAAVRALESATPGLRAVFLQGCAGNQNPYREQRTFERAAQHGAAVAEAVRQALDTLRPVAALPLVNVAQAVAAPLADGDTTPCPLHGLRLGEAWLVGLGGEAFVEYALYVRAHSPAASTLVLGYTDGAVGYLPTEAAFAEGGYEVNAHPYFPVGRPWSPGIEAALKQGLNALLSRLGTW